MHIPSCHSQSLTSAEIPYSQPFSEFRGDLRRAVLQLWIRRPGSRAWAFGLWFCMISFKSGLIWSTAGPSHGSSTPWIPVISTKALRILPQTTHMRTGIRTGLSQGRCSTSPCFRTLLCSLESLLCSSFPWVAITGLLQVVDLLSGHWYMSRRGCIHSGEISAHFDRREPSDMECVRNVRQCEHW